VRPALLDDHAAIRLRDRREDRVEIEWAQRARIDHLGVDAVLVGERLSGALRGDRHP
jgi:predicted nucleic acid-binding protein